MTDIKKDNRIGKYVVTTVTGESVRAYVPNALPPVPEIDIEPLLGLMADANRALGRLDGVASILPDTPLFLYMYVRKEALLSSQIEGTQSSLSDLLLFESDEAPGVPLDDVQEVSNYVAAMNHGLEQLRGDFPLSLRLIKDIHNILLSKGRGSTKQPGEFRRSQNWIGGIRPSKARFVPPPPEHVLGCMSDLERFIHDESSKLPLLIRAALVHVQFETIHPFLDGNGRLGRLLITFMLCNEGVLSEPILYLSLFLKTHRDVYYDLLQRVRTEGAWEEWLEFFLEGVRETSEQAAETARQILALFATDQEKLSGLGRASASAFRVFQYVQTKPLVTVSDVSKALNMSAPTARKSINHLVDVSILFEPTERKRDRVYAYQSYLDILNQGTDPL